MQQQKARSAFRHDFSRHRFTISEGHHLSSGTSEVVADKVGCKEHTELKSLYSEAEKVFY